MLRFTYRHTGPAGAPYYSTFYTDGLDQAAADFGVETFSDFWEAIAGYITSGDSIGPTGEVELVDPATGKVTDVYQTTTGTVGSTGNAPLPKATQGLLRLNTSHFVNGRRLRGRLFIPSLANDAQLNGVPSVAFTGSLETAAEAARDALSVYGSEWTIYSPTHRESSAVSTVTVWNQFAVLRSRRD